MSTFHKPRVFRSPSGCCICRAKSSSSRFTDSARYSEHYSACFRLTEERDGEICNACVLLVKRWQKLPPGSVRHWGHVVDARRGPAGRGGLVRRVGRGEEDGRGGLYKIRRKVPVVRREEVARETARQRAARRLEEDPLSGFLATGYWGAAVTAGCSCLLLRGGAGEAVALRTCVATRTPLSSVETLIEAELAALQAKDLAGGDCAGDPGYSTGSSTSSYRTGSRSPDSLRIDEDQASLLDTGPHQ